MDEWRRALPVALITSLIWLSLFALYLLFARRHPAAQPIQIMPPESSPASATALPTPTPAPLRVYVSGAVRAPGVYRLPADSIVDDAVTAAGGPTADADLIAINLAHPLSDGEQVYVPDRNDDAGVVNLSQMNNPPLPTADNPTPAPPAPVDLNTATADELEALPGIGPKTAQAIIDQRPYSQVDDLLRVKGIGEKTLARLRPYVEVK